MKFLVKKYIKIILWIVSYFALAIAYPATIPEIPENQLMTRFSNSPQNSLLSIFLIGVVFYISRRTVVFSAKRLGTWVASFIVAVLYTLTFSLLYDNQINIEGTANILITVITIIGMMNLFAHLFASINDILVDKVHINESEHEVITPFWMISILLLVIWVVQIWPLLPGMISWDGYRQFLEFERTKIDYLNFQYYPTNHHPWSATLILGGLFSLGRKIAGVDFGVLLIVIVQMVAATLTYTSIIKYVQKRLGNKWALGVFVFYSLPIFAFWTVIVEKTGLFLIFGSLFVFMFVRAFFKLDFGWKQSVMLVISSVMMSAFRNDAGYIVILSLIVLIVVKIFTDRRVLKMTLAVFAIFMAIYIGWNKIALPQMGVVAGSTGEMLTIPMRQLTEVAIKHPKDFSGKDWQSLNKITPKKTLETYYNVEHADDLKSTFPVDTFLRNEQEIKDVQAGRLKEHATKRTASETAKYISLWVKMLVKHPKSYVLTFFDANKKFLNPMIDNGNDSRSIMFGNGYMNTNRFLQPTWYHEFHYWFKTTNSTFNWVNILFSLPGLMFVTSSGFMIWFILWALGNLFDKSWWYIFSLTPIVLLAAVSLLSPVDGMFRYILGAYVTIPMLLLSVLLAAQNESK